MGFTSFIDNIDVWFKASKDKYINQYYTYIFVYVYGSIIMYKQPHKFMYMLTDTHNVNPPIIGDPKLYLASDIGKVYYVNGSYALSMSSDSYVKEDIRNVKK